MNYKAQLAAISSNFVTISSNWQQLAAIGSNWQQLAAISSN